MNRAIPGLSTAALDAFSLLWCPLVAFLPRFPLFWVVWVPILPLSAPFGLLVPPYPHPTTLADPEGDFFPLLTAPFDFSYLSVDCAVFSKSFAFPLSFVKVPLLFEQSSQRLPFRAFCFSLLGTFLLARPLFPSQPAVVNSSAHPPPRLKRSSAAPTPVWCPRQSFAVSLFSGTTFLF